MVGIAAGLAAAGALSATGSIVGSGASAGASKQASALQQQEYAATVAQENPYINAGYSTVDQQAALAQYAGSNLGSSPYLTAATANMPATAGAMTEAELQATPGYQFTLSQGLKSTQAANAARGLGVSGAALKGAATYATGLADSTYSNRFNEAQQTFQDYLNQNTAYQGNLLNEYNMLSGTSSLGQNAASQTGYQGASLANAAGNYLSQSGQATQAGTQGASNSLANAINNYAGYNYWQGQSGGTQYNFSPAVSSNAPDYTGGATSTQLNLLGLPNSA